MTRFSFLSILLRLGLLLYLCHVHNDLLAQKNVQIKAFDTPPQIDGLLSEEIWKTAEPVTDFIQRGANYGQQFSEKSALRSPTQRAIHPA